MGQPPGRLPSALPSHYNSRVPGKSLETLAEGGWGRSPCTVPGLGRTRSHDALARRDPRSFPATAAPSGSQQTLTPFSLPSALGLGALLTAGVGPSSEYPGQGPARAPPGDAGGPGLTEAWRSGRLHPGGGTGAEEGGRAARRRPFLPTSCHGYQSPRATQGRSWRPPPHCPEGDC